MKRIHTIAELELEKNRLRQESAELRKAAGTDLRELKTRMLEFGLPWRFFRRHRNDPPAAHSSAEKVAVVADILKSISSLFPGKGR